MTGPKRHVQPLGVVNPMRTTLLLPLLGLAFAACSSTATQQQVEEVKKDWLDPNPILATEIESRIESIPYRHGEELVNHLMWLVERGEVAAGQTLEGLYHEDAKVRSNCAWILGQMGQRGILPNTHAILPHLETLLTDEHEAVRLESASSLMALGDFAAVPVLIEGMDSESARARFLCSKSLERATKREVDFDHLATDPAERAESIAVWRRWWAKQSNDPFFHDNYAKTYGLPTLAEQEGTNGVQQPVDPSAVPAVPMGEVMPKVDTKTTTDPTSNTGNSSQGGEGSETTGTVEQVEATGTPVESTETPVTTTPTGTETTEKPKKSASPFEWLRRKN